MAIDNFLREYRDYMYTKDSLLSLLNSNSSRTDIEVVVLQTNQIVKELLKNSLFLDKNLIEIKEEIDNIYNRIDLKLDKIIDISEGYQNLNTNELVSEPIYSFNIFEIKDNKNYNSFHQALTLLNVNNTKNKFPDQILQSNINGIEHYNFEQNLDNKLLKIDIVDESNTILKKINIYNANNDIITSYNENRLFNLKDISRIEVATDNENSNKQRYTTLNLLETTYKEYASIYLADKRFKKEGDLFKLSVDFEVPTECYVTLKVTIKYVDKVTEKFKKIAVYSNLNGDKEILVDKHEMESLNKEYKQITTLEVLQNDLIFIESFSTEPELFIKTGYNVFDISKIRCDDFDISVSMDIYSFVNDNKTPKIKGVYGYVTK